MRTDKCILRHFFRILLIPKKLMDHRVNPVPVPTNHFVEGSLVAGFKPVYQHTVEGDVLRFGCHTLSSSVMDIFLNCSH